MTNPDTQVPVRTPTLLGLADQTSAILAFSQGSKEVHVGDRFGWWDDTVWEVVAFACERTYSPSGFGGTPTVVVRLLHGDAPRVSREGPGIGETEEWCGDSVAAGLHHYADRIPEHLRARSRTQEGVE